MMLPNFTLPSLVDFEKDPREVLEYALIHYSPGSANYHVWIQTLRGPGIYTEDSIMALAVWGELIVANFKALANTAVEHTELPSVGLENLLALALLYQSELSAELEHASDMVRKHRFRVMLEVTSDTDVMPVVDPEITRITTSPDPVRASDVPVASSCTFNRPPLQFKRLTEHTNPVPSYATKMAAGMDLQAVHACVILPGERALIPTEWAVALPDGHYGRIAPRSSLAYKQGIDVLAGVVDTDYRGGIGVILLNTSDDIYSISPGDKVAQFIVEACGYYNPVEVKDLPDTERGAGGFGSTGK